MSKNIKKNLVMLIVLHCSSKARTKELLKHLKPDTMTAIWEYVINIINKNIEVSDKKKRKFNRHRDKIRELANTGTSQKKRQ